MTMCIRALAICFCIIHTCSLGSHFASTLASPLDVQIEDEAYLLQTQTQVKSRANTHLDNSQDNAHSASQMGALPQSKMTGDIMKESVIDVDNTNIVFVKVPKCGSTTGSGVTRRIAEHHNLTGVFTDDVWMADAGEPGVFARHGALDQEEFGENPLFEGVFRDDLLPNMSAITALKLPTFLWTVIRKPAERAMSFIYYKSDQKGEPASTDFKMFMLHETVGNVMFRYVRSSAADTLDDIFSIYGLIGVMERYDESLVVLAAMLKVPLSDVLYVAAKNSSKDTMIDANKHLPLDEEPEIVKTYIDTNFRESNDLDYQLYERANRTLSQKIEELNLQPAIKRFKKFLSDAQQACGTQDPESMLCYWKDQGCNYECFNQFDASGLQLCEWCSQQM